MRSSCVGVAIVIAAAVVNPVWADTDAGPVTFRAHSIDHLPEAYQVAVTDVDGDGRPDVTALAQLSANIAWYKNPGWAKTPLGIPVKGLIDLAPFDIDHDGSIDFALATGFIVDKGLDGGALQWAGRAGKGGPWQLHKIDDLPNNHRVRWVDIDGDGVKEVAALPMCGQGALEKPTPLYWYSVPPHPDADAWPRHLIDDKLIHVHGVRVVQWDADSADELLIASSDGVNLFDYRADRRLWDRTRLAQGNQTAHYGHGTGEITVGTLPEGAGKRRRFLATVEPVHGHEMVVYTQNKGLGPWVRSVVDDTLYYGHAVATADFDGDGRDEIVAGYRGAGRQLLLYRTLDDTGTSWQRSVIDDGDMGAGGVVVTDLNGDGRLDIVAGGPSSGTVKWYENLGPSSAPMATAKPEEKAQVIVFGDSLAAGWSHVSGGFFPGRPYLNRGVADETTAAMLPRFRRDVIAHHPQTIVILAGSDELGGKSGPAARAAITDNLETMSEVAQAGGVHVVLASLLPSSLAHSSDRRPAERRAVNSWIAAYAARRGHRFLDVYRPLADDHGFLKPALTSDGVHLNRAGYTVLSDLVGKVIAQP